MNAKPAPDVAAAEPVATSPNWWLDPAIAKLAFGAGPKCRGASNPWGAEERLDLDLEDPEQRELGEFELLELIGEGGMGLVYRARQTRLQREVAVKLLSAGPWASPEFVARFQQEAQHAAQLQHPGIVTVFEMGELDGLVYYAMQLVRGESLAQLLQSKGGKLPQRDAAALMRTVAEAVAYAHSLGVLHLDLKPANILLDESGQPRVADFGLARRIDPEGLLANEFIAGTPSYMAPEQASVGEQALTRASDVWGMGAVLYEMLCGRPPFEGSSAVATLELLRTGELQPPSRYVQVSPDLEAICLKCLAQAPLNRYPDARALADDLGRFLEGRDVSVRPRNGAQRLVRWARREPMLAATAGFAVLALAIGVIATSLQWRRAESHAMSASERLWDSRREAALRLEQDGKGFEAIPRLLENIEELHRAGRPRDVAMEQRRIGLMSGQGATLIDSIVVADANPMSVGVSPDGTLVAVGFNDQSVRWYDATTMTERGRISLAGRPTSDGQPRVPLLLRFLDSRRLLVTLEWFSNLASPNEGDSWLIDVERAEMIDPPRSFANFVEARWSSNGRFAVLGNSDYAGQVWAANPWRPLSPMKTAISRARYRTLNLPLIVDPQGQFVASLSIAMRELRLHAASDLSNVVRVGIPGEAGVSAWALDQTGDQLALGDFEGRLFLLNTRSRRLRQLPAMRGREMTWVSFSEDGSWLAASNFDGSVYAFDVRSGVALVSGQMHAGFSVKRVELSSRNRLVVATGEGTSAIWRIPAPGARTTNAQRMGAGPAPHGLSGRYPIGWSKETDLIASAGMDGQIRLWRLPAAAQMPARSARQMADSLRFSGRGIVDVAWDHVRIIDAKGQAKTSWLRLPGPPGFAELLDDDRLLVVTVGPEFRAYDTSTWRMRGPPLALPNSPQHLSGDAAGSPILLGFNERGPGGMRERLWLVDSRTAARLPAEAFLEGWQRRVSMADDGLHIVASGTAEGSTIVLDGRDLSLIGEYPHDPYEPVQWAAFRGNGDDVLLATRATDQRLGEDKLVVWDARRDKVVSEQRLSRVWPLGVNQTPGGVFIAGSVADLAVDRSQRSNPIMRLASSEPTAAFAVSSDGRLFARGFRREVQLYDAETWAPVGAPLQGDVNGMDLITLLAFSPGANKLLARTSQHRWIVWSTAPDPRPPHELDAEMARLAISQEHQKVVRALRPDERAILRARDVRTATDSAPRPTPATEGFSTEGDPIPARSAAAPEHLVNLANFYDFAPDTVRNTFYNVLPAMGTFPVGVQRFGGVDFDLRGMMQIGVARTIGDPSEVVRLECLPVPMAKFVALRPLLLLSLNTPAATGQVVAIASFRYTDGGVAEVPLRAGMEVPGFDGDDSDVPLMFADHVTVTLGLDQNDRLSGPRLVNPHPDRAVRCLGLSISDRGGPILLLAVTLEPPEPATTVTP